MLRLVLACAALVCLIPEARAASSLGLAPEAEGVIEFGSKNPNGPRQLMRGEGEPVTIRGTLAFPPGGASALPAMVISHGSGGIRPDREEAWAERLRGLGVATFVVDSFGPRGIVSTAADQSQLALAASVHDGLAALELLTRHPRIDPGRIGVIGFSKGAQVALYSTLEVFRAGALGTAGPRFALHVGLYASCANPYFAPAVTGAPILMLLGGADDYTPAAPCDRYADWFRSKGAEVRKIVYPDAHHGFDGTSRVRLLRDVQTSRNCHLDVTLEPYSAVRRDTGETVPAREVAAYLRGCVERGAHFGGNPAARAAAIEEVARAVRETLRP